MFFYHLSGMGYEAWEHASPATDEDQCIKSVWEMVCYTYFPQAEAGCRPGEESNYQRPCRGSCEAYKTKCNVECCDESAQCVFSHPLGFSGDTVQTGYVDLPGPSAQCTGSNSSGRQTAQLSMALLLGILGFHLAGHLDSSSDCPAPPKENRKARASAPRRWLLVCAIAACTLFLQGCEVDVPLHQTGNWHKKADYLVESEFIQPGKAQASAQLNSCSVPVLSPALQCSGHG